MRILLPLIMAGLLVGCGEDKSAEFDTKPFDPVTMDIANIDAAFPPAIKEVSIPSHGERMNGHLYQANGEGPHPTVILLHGFPGNEKNLDIAQALRRSGYNVLFFHYRGAWGSGGDYSLSNVIEDVSSSANYLRQNSDSLRVDKSKLILLGHSLGGFAALHGGANEPDIHCVGAMAAADFGTLGQAFEMDKDSAKGFALSASQLSMLNIPDGTAFMQDIIDNKARYALASTVSDYDGKHVLLIGGDRDKVLPPETFHHPMTALYGDGALKEVRTLTLPDDHSFSGSRMALTHAVLDWVNDCSKT